MLFVEASLPDVLVAASPQAQTIYRIDVLPKDWAQAALKNVSGLGDYYAYPVYWFRGADNLADPLSRLAQSVLIDTILEKPFVSVSNSLHFNQALWEGVNPQMVLERQFMPGVTDNLGKTVESAMRLMFPNGELDTVQVASGTVYLFLESQFQPEALVKQTAYQLYNPLVERAQAYLPTEEAIDRFRFPVVSGAALLPVETVDLDLDDAGLLALSQARGLALSTDEMRLIRDHYRSAAVQSARQNNGLGQWPSDIELEVFAQTWSEHCKHKIFAATIDYTDAGDPKKIQRQTIHGLFKTFIAGSTEQLMARRPDLLSVFVDNAGVLQWNEDWAVCFKAETHNSPSALEPYGGALTGIVGVNRDILGTGLGAKPLFNTDVFCFAHPGQPHVNRDKMIPAQAIVKGVRKGVEDGGNKSGIPTVNGALCFDARYRAKPMVFCGTGGLLPMTVNGQPGYGKYTQPGDTIVMAGGRVGKDGIHGATFSSEAMHQDSPVSAVQIGDPLTQKRLSDFMLDARDQGLLTGVTDNGAGGLSSSVGEMAELTHGATIHLERVPLKYAGLAPYEIVISESQERMTFSTNRYPDLLALAENYDVEIADIGTFHDQGTFDVVLNGQMVASLDLEFLHNGLPKMQLKATWAPQRERTITARPFANVTKVLLKLLQSPNICSREALIRQYDHEVQGRSVIKPLMGPDQTAPCDAAVLRPVLDDPAGLVVSNGLCPQFSDYDAYAMASCAADEAVRNAVAVGADPASIALLDNFCWPDPVPGPRNPDAELKMAQLVRACIALNDLALNYGTPLISGKDSMKNDFDDGTFRLSIPPTLLVSAIGKIPDGDKAVSMEFKAPGDGIYLLGKTSVHMGGSEYYRQMGWYSPYCPRVEKTLARKLYAALFECMKQGWIRSCHDCSEGGLAVALAESALGSRFGCSVTIDPVLNDSPELRWDEALFSESPSRFVLTVSPQHRKQVEALFDELPLLRLGEVSSAPAFIVTDARKVTRIRTDVSALRQAWQTPPAPCLRVEGVSA